MSQEQDQKKRRRRKLDDLRAQLDRLGYGRNGGKNTHVVSAADLDSASLRKSRKSGSGKAESKAADSAQAAIVYRRDLPRQLAAARSPAAAAPQSEPGGNHISLDEAVPGTVLSEPDIGRAFLVATEISDLPGCGALAERFAAALADSESGLCSHLARLQAAPVLRPQDLIFLDVESTGLGTSPLFLVGVMSWQDNGFCASQYLARDYAEEAAVIRLFVRDCAARRLLVTFNGKSFDFPFLRARAAANAVRFGLDPLHFDLLHACRRVWKESLPNCRLQTLETYVCGRVRQGDIPGAEIPDAYHDFVRTANAGKLVRILRHNLLDLVTMAEIMTRFPAGGA
jgi:uncharacterized protein YprB with RNaseH-like and TPR domain